MYLTISIEFALIAALRGHSFVLREYNNIMINMKIKTISYNNEKYEKKENAIKQWEIWKERECHKKW